MESFHVVTVQVHLWHIGTVQELCWLLSREFKKEQSTTFCAYVPGDMQVEG